MTVLSLPADLAPTLRAQAEQLVAECGLAQHPNPGPPRRNPPRCVECHRAGRLSGHHTADGAVVWVAAAANGGRIVVDLQPGGEQAWAHAVAVACTELAVDAGHVEEGHLDGLLLLGYGGRLWTLAHAIAIPHPDEVAALGSGEGPAIGALDVLLAQGCPIADAVPEAVRIAVRRDRYSAEPIQVEVLG